MRKNQFSIFNIGRHIFIVLIICVVYFSITEQVMAFDMPRRTSCTPGPGAQQLCNCGCGAADSCTNGTFYPGNQNCTSPEGACCTDWESCFNDGSNYTWQCGAPPPPPISNTPVPPPTSPPTRTPTPTHRPTRTPTPTPIPPTPTFTLTPTPYVRVEVKNPYLTPVPAAQICKANCSTVPCDLTACLANQASGDFAFDGNLAGGRINDSSLQVIGVTPSASGYDSPDCGGASLGYCYVWDSWNTGVRKATFIVITPTPDPNACVCDSFIYNGVFTAGETTDFTAFAKVNASLYPNAKVNTIIYHVERDGTEIANSGEVSVDGPVRRLEGTTPYDVYNSLWHYEVPSEGSGEMSYRVWTQTSCGSKTARIIQRSNVAGVSAERKIEIGFFDRLKNFFSRLLAVIENSRPLAWIKPPASNVLSAEVQVQSGEPVPTPTPTQAMSIKYTNFTPANLIEQTCSAMTFHLIYN